MLLVQPKDGRYAKNAGAVFNLSYHWCPKYRRKVLVVNRLKGASSRILRGEFLHLKPRLPTLWSRSYYVLTVGHVSEATVKKYIESQKGR
jgi:REP element-mobilizing transposase RayT